MNDRERRIELAKYIGWANKTLEKATGDKVKQQMVQISYQAYCKAHEIEELLRDVPVDRRKEYLDFAKETLQWMMYYTTANNNKEDC